MSPLGITRSISEAFMKSMTACLADVAGPGFEISVLVMTTLIHQGFTAAIHATRDASGGE